GPSFRGDVGPGAVPRGSFACRRALRARHENAAHQLDAALEVRGQQTGGLVGIPTPASLQDGRVLEDSLARGTAEGPSDPLVALAVVPQGLYAADGPGRA